MSLYGRLTSKLIRGDGAIWHWCPACKCAHHFDVPRWKYNGHNDRPSFTPSMRISRPFYDKIMGKMDESKRKTICHYFLTDGYIIYCSDSPHELAGQKVMLPDFPPHYHIGDFET